MRYNDGHIHDLKLVSEDEQKVMIHDFAEGSSQLEQFLLTCNKYGIYTDGCCAGHDNESLPYVTMIYDENDKKFNEIGKYYINQIVNYIQFDMDESLKKDVQLDIEHSHNKNKVTIFFSNNKCSNIMWYFFSQLKLNSSEPINEDLECVFNISKYLKNFNSEIRFSENDNTKDLCIFFPNICLFRSDDMPDLSLNIDRVKNGKRYLHGYFKCDSNTLKEFYDELKKLYKFIDIKNSKTM